MGKRKLPVRHQEAKEWAQLLIKRINAFEAELQDDNYARWYTFNSEEVAAIKRTSMDLSKALVRLRHPDKK